MASRRTDIFRKVRRSLPAVVGLPRVRTGSVIRPSGPIPFDHTSLAATLHGLFGFVPLTARDAAPDLRGVLAGAPVGDGPPFIAAPAVPPVSTLVAHAAANVSAHVRAFLGWPKRDTTALRVGCRTSGRRSVPRQFVHADHPPAVGVPFQPG